MLVTCPKCSTQFTPAAAVCPGCGDYRPPLESTVDYETYQAQLAISGGEAPHLVHERLLGQGFSEFVADEIIAIARRRVRRTNRQTGGYRILVGSGLLFTGGSLWLMTGGVVLTYGSLATGFALLIAGVIQYLSGANIE